MTNPNNKDDGFSKIARAWQKILLEKGCEHTIRPGLKYGKLKRFSRSWRRIFKYLDINPYNRPDLSVFDVGCGRARHLVSFALNKWQCVGIDCSKEVLERAESYIQQASSIFGENITVDLIHGDFLSYEPGPNLNFDVVFHVGVLEHFLDRKERMDALRKMFYLAKPGGWVVSVVPSAGHPLRRKMRESGLGGYDIPEIDYTPELLFEEMNELGGRNIFVFGHAMFNYLLLERRTAFFFKKMFYLAWQLIPVSWLPAKFSFKHVGTLVAIAKK